MYSLRQRHSVATPTDTPRSHPFRNSPEENKRTGRSPPKTKPCYLGTKQQQEMAVAVSRDLTVQVLKDVNSCKLIDRQQALRAAIQKGEPKCLGVSQVILGLMVMLYSIPLHLTQETQVVTFAVPWWCGITFFTAGVVAIILDKHITLRILQVCLVLSAVSIVMAVTAVIIYSVDISQNPAVPCDEGTSTSTEIERDCDEKYFAMALSTGIKSSLLIFTLAQGTLSSIIGFLLLQQKQNFIAYTSLSAAAPTALLPVEQNQEAISDRTGDE
ncbi:transmembrane protein 176 isoform X1 [Oryzias melastigma]|uniref:Uncharacterized LOC112137551 n=1 Tax=Oryzias melastigma TaxID=30732 RepID=A0A3B3DJY5_ORYME|nr:transmembrane protein 176 isoform X1 [Oryzias melastigma]